MAKIPKSRLIVGYSDFFGEDCTNRINLIKNISKTNLITEISGLNYRLKPNDIKYQDYSITSQDRELFYFCGERQDLYDKYGAFARKYIRSKNDYPLIFTRQSCLFALKEIINSEIPVMNNFSMRDSWENLLQYLLCVNTIVSNVRKDNKEELEEGNPDAIGIEQEAKEKAAISFEDINAKIIVLNELNINSDQLYVPFRAHKFLLFMTNHAVLGKYTVEYLNDIYNMDYERFIFEIMSLYMANNPDKKNNVKTPSGLIDIDTTFIYHTKEDNTKIFETLSQSLPNDTPEKLLSIRKYPFYNGGDFYILTDNTILLEKIYSQFINDFWFDKVKILSDQEDKLLFNIKFYRAVIGQFFEGYIDQSLRFMSANAKHFKVRTFDELKFDVNGQEQELSDIYIRYVDKVFIAEAKSTGIYDKEKYSGDLNEFYKESREKFFDSFGMKQIINAISNLKSLAPNFDAGFPRTGIIKIFPALVVNEKALQTPLMAQVFNNRFQELIRELDLPKFKVAALSIIHISDFESMEEYLHENPLYFWKILENHVVNSQFMPPFYNTLNVNKIKPNYTKPSELYYSLINRYQPNN